MPDLPDLLEVVIEVPRWSLVKRRSDGRVDYVSPVPAPFNYGSVPGRIAEDGEPLDAVVLGSRLPRGHRGTYPVLGVIRFTDAGRRDDKVVCGQPPLTVGRLIRLLAFFRAYALAKRGLNRLRGLDGPTRSAGFEAH